MYKNYLKRVMDMIFSLLLLIILSPVFFILYLCVKVKLGSPVLFRQERPGKDERVFMMYKFRTMTDARNDKGEFLEDEDRLTAFGKKLRSTSLDELPELLNIMKGDMSFVGPRPLLVQYLPLYNSTQKRRHELRPGLTGLAQVRGRNSISWEEKFDLDVEYVENVSFKLDCKILLETVKKVIAKEGISSNNSETMPPFTG